MQSKEIWFHSKGNGFHFQHHSKLKTKKRMEHQAHNNKSTKQQKNVIINHDYSDNRLITLNHGEKSFFKVATGHTYSIHITNRAHTFVHCYYFTYISIQFCCFFLSFYSLFCPVLCLLPSFIHFHSFNTIVSCTLHSCWLL